MSLTKIGSIGINTGIELTGVTTIATLNASDNVLSVGGTVNFVSDVSIGGSVSIGGTLTYEDVTNIDAVGLITARNGIVVGSGITLSKDGDIFATGVTTTGSLVSNGAISGTTGTFTGNVSIADKIVHTGDTNTAIRFSGADTITAETGGSEAIRVDSSQRLLLGTNTSRTVGGAVARKLQVEGSDGSAGISIIRNQNSASPPALSFGNQRSGSSGGNTIVQDDDNLGIIQFTGADGTDANTSAASIAGFVDGTPGSNDMPGRLVFSTTADGASSTTERLRINSDGRLLIGSTSVVNVGGASNSGYLQIEGTSANRSSLALINNQNSQQSPVIRFGKSRGTSVGSVTTVADDDLLGRIAFAGADGTDLENSTAVIEAKVNGTVAGNQIPTDLIFETSPTDNSSRAERFRIASGGDILTSGNTQLFGSNTSDGSDNKAIMINGGGATSDSRGGYLIVHGNEHSSNPGIARLHAGNVGTANIQFYTAGSQRLSIASNGLLTVTTTGSDSGIRLVDSSTSSGSPNLEIISKRVDANVNTAFSSNIFLGRNRTDQKIATNTFLGTVAFGGNHTDATEANISYAAAITARSSGDFNSKSDMPTDLIFTTGTSGTDRDGEAAGSSNVGTERLRITSNGDVLIGFTDELTDTKVRIDGNIGLSNSATGTGGTVKQFVLSKTYSMSTSGTNILTFDNWGTAAFDITVFRKDTVSPAGAQVSKLYIGFHGSGTNITQATLAQENKVIRGSIHSISYSISENNNTATLIATGDNTGGETQTLVFHILGHGNGGGEITVV